MLRLLRLTLFPSRPAGPRTARRLLALSLFVPAFLLLQCIHWIGLLLDDLLFRGYRAVEIREPVFVVGLPRSGTSFLQRVLAKDSERFTTLRLWELLLAPSISERKVWRGLGAVDRLLGQPAGRFLAWGARRGFGWMEAIHKVRFDDPEEDYFLLLPIFACFLLVVPFPYHPEIWRLAHFDELPPEDRQPVMTFYQRMIQRHLYVVGQDKQLLSKNPSFTPFIRSLREAFPDGRIVCCVRNPVAVAPSLLSSLRPGCRLFGYDVGDRLVRDQFVDMLQFFGQHMLSEIDGDPAERSAFAPLQEVRNDVEGFVTRLYRRFGWEVSPSFSLVLDGESERGRSHESKHRYSLEEFGLEREDLRRRFHGLNRRFGYGEAETAGEAGIP